MKIYIAGKITGLESWDYKERFHVAAMALKAAGHIPLNPCNMFPENPVWDWSEYVLADLRIIFQQADAVLMLENWKDSKGARLEHYAAQLIGRPIYYVIDKVPLNLLCKHCEALVSVESKNDYFGFCGYECLKAWEVNCVAKNNAG